MMEYGLNFGSLFRERVRDLGCSDGTVDIQRQTGMVPCLGNLLHQPCCIALC